MSMKYLVEINNKTKEKISKKKVETIFEKTVVLALGESFEGKKFELSLALVGEAEIKTLNKQYRKKDTPTDVLSFAEYEGRKKMLLSDLNAEKSEVFLGELIICPSFVRESAVEDGEIFDFAMTNIISHGILHLLGFSHGEKMFSIHKKVAKKLG
ncbi:MAG: rRNA maturation RNase YbeY [Candidatus Moranbacteria bacterium]|nr:rRNA maturation RNase YbeY [Candidatus Moranbacteria bacterium]